MNSDLEKFPLLPRPGLIKRIRLDHARVQYQKRSERHVLQQLFWECTLRRNLNYLHCGSDCRTTSNMDDMPLRDFLSVLDDVCSVKGSKQIFVVTTDEEPLVGNDICACGRAIREKVFQWGMVSNGLLLDERCKHSINYRY